MNVSMDDVVLFGFCLILVSLMRKVRVITFYSISVPIFIFLLEQIKFMCYYLSRMCNANVFLSNVCTF